MTVKHLQTIQRQQSPASVVNDATVIHKFKSGFHECAGEVSRFIGSMDGVENGVKQRLISHLTNCVNGLSQISQYSLPPTPLAANNYHNINIQPQPQQVILPQVSFAPGDVNNNSGESARIQMPGGIQLIPSRLPTGELALLVPNSSNMSFFPSSFGTNKPIVDSSTQYEPTYPKTDRVSAFTTVTRTFSPNNSPLGSPASSTQPEEHKTPSPPIITIPYQATSTPFAQYKPESMVSSTSIEAPSSDLKIKCESVPIFVNRKPEYSSVIKSAEKYQWKTVESRKRPLEEDRLLIVADTKLRKYSEVSSSEQYSSTGFETSSSENKTDSSAENLSFESSSVNTSGSSTSASGSNESMWRPW